MNGTPSTARPLHFQFQIISLSHRIAHRISGGRTGSLDAAKQAPSGMALRIITRVHRALYRLTGGVVGASAGGMSTLLLTTRGRKSGRPRTVPLPFFRVPANYGDAVAVVASFAGNPKNPAWYSNLAADPNVAVQLGRRRFRTRVELVTDEQRRELWPFIVLQAPMYADYQRITARTIPLVLVRGAVTEES
jgi:deazaflavin-dependent oxidoreductase (nitroreductase family)